MAERYPWQLSGGQRQRVGLARALAGDPEVLLMDEPFGALDPLTRAEMQTMLRELLRRVGKTTLIVTHDLDEALYLADRVVLLEAGRVVADLAASEVRDVGESRRCGSMLPRPSGSDGGMSDVSASAWRGDCAADVRAPVADGERDAVCGGDRAAAGHSADAAVSAGAAGAGGRERAADDSQPGAVWSAAAGAVAGRARGAAGDCGADRLCAAADPAQYVCGDSECGSRR